MRNLRVTVVCFATIAGAAIPFVGCGRESPVAVQSPNAGQLEMLLRTQSDAKRKQRTWASTQFPGGNDRTQQFLAWSHERYAVYCSMELDADGECIELNIHPCWPTSDEELKVISELPRVRSLSFSGSAITDDGLDHLESMPALMRLDIVGASQITDERVERLKFARSDLKIDLSYRKVSPHCVAH